MLPHEFSNKWSRSRLKERSASQSHFNDLCRMLGQPTPADVDPDGAFYTFEKGAAKASGGDGWADVWKRGHFAWEYKGKHKDLDAAYRQLQQYRDALENPPLLVVSDMDIIQIYTNFTDTIQKIYRIPLLDIGSEESLRVLHALFEDPNALRPGRTTSPITEQMAAKFADVANSIRKRGIEPERAAHFLTRMVFCLFAEDVGLLPAGHVSTILEETAHRPLYFQHYIKELFGAMAHGGVSLMKDIRHFNGGLFADDDVIELSTNEIPIIRDASKQDWSSIEPAIFGTLFERGLDPAKRSQIGAHYTHPDDILAVLEPVLMTPLRREWDEVRERALVLHEMAVAPAARRANPQAAIGGLLLGFLDRLRQVTVLDPACGSGNFLYLSMNLLKDLELEVITFGAGLGLTMPMPAVTPTQLRGIEINPYARDLAQAAIWIGFIQWHRKRGIPFDRTPVLDPLDTIEHRDAILDLTDPAHPREAQWPDAEFIVGNPPFLGGNRVRAELGDQYVEAVFGVYGDRLPNFSDLVCYWFEKARAMVAAGKVKRAGLLATQGIRGGANRRVLERIKETGDIFFAWADRPWILDGAAVHISIVGFDNGSESEQTLDGKPTTAINANLTANVDITKARQLRDNLGICFMGPSPKAPFDIDAMTAQSLIDAPININGRPNSDVVRPVASAIDLTQRPRGKWTVDFGFMSLEEAAMYELPFEYVKKTVFPVRVKNQKAAYSVRWWQYGRPRVEMREALIGRPRFIATPGVAKHRIYVWVEPSILCNQGTLVYARDDDYTFGVLHSRIHEVWARATGTQLREVESGFRYTPTTCFETFPFPRPTDAQREAIAAAARDLNALRENWLNPPGMTAADLKKRTLTNLYNQRPTWLANLHERLDTAVLDAYGWPHGLSNDGLLAGLLALNLERAPAGGAAAVVVGDAEDDGEGDDEETPPYASS